MKTRKKLYLNVLFVLMTVAMLVSCTQEVRKKTELSNFSDNMHSSYTAEISYNLSAPDFALSGNAIISKEKANISLKLLSPEPYSGMTIDYDVTGVPESVAVHFSGIDTTLPNEAVSKINAIVQLFFDDFLDILSKQSSDKIAVVENVTSGENEYFTQVPFGNSVVGVRFSESGALPLYFEFTGDELSGNIAFNNFQIATENK